MLFPAFLFLCWSTGFGEDRHGQGSPFHGSTALPTLVRSKRQVYYLCGRYPRSYYSNYPCYSISNAHCENGGRKIGVGCTIANQCVAYYAGPVTCLRSCCCTVPTSLPIQINSRQGYCPNGQLSSIRCSGSNQCGSPNLSCLSGLCCPRTSTDPAVACGGQHAISQCSSQRVCHAGLVCTTANFCCHCPVGRSGGRCNRGLCATGYTCQPNGYCCASCFDNTMPFGMCINGQCGGERRCSAGNICC